MTIQSEAPPAERLLRALVAESRDVLALLDSDGTLVLTSPSVSDALGYTPEQAIGHTLFELVHPEDADGLAAALQAVLSADRASADTVARYQARTGEWRTLEIRLTNLLAHPDLGGILAQARDVTESRLRDLRLRQAEGLASLGTMLTAVIHEVSNPLTGILGFTRLLKDSLQEPANLEAVDIIQQEAQRLGRIVAGVQRLAEDARAAPLRGPISLNEAIHHVLAVRRYALETRGIVVQAELSSKTPPVLADRSQLEQVLLNLIRNAEQAMAEVPGERRLVLRSRVNGDRILLSVADTGSGVAPEDRSKIFEPFWSTRATEQGSGLGLNLARTILEEHGGLLTLESEAGRGTTVTLTLPVWHDPVRAAPRAASPYLGRPRIYPLRVLVVDDEATIRLWIRRLLEARGHQVTEANDGEQAAWILTRSPQSFDLVLADYRMPRMDGVELIRWIEAEMGRLARRVVLLTGDTLYPVAADLLARTHIQVLQKPLNSSELEELVDHFAEAVAVGA